MNIDEDAVPKKSPSENAPHSDRDGPPVGTPQPVVDDLQQGSSPKTAPRAEDDARKRLRAPPSSRLDIRHTPAFYTVTYRFLAEGRDWDQTELEQEFDIPDEELWSIVGALMDDGFLEHAGRSGSPYHPARSLREWFTHLGSNAEQFRLGHPGSTDEDVARALTMPDHVADAVLGDGAKELAYRAGLTSTFKTKHSQGVEPEKGGTGAAKPPARGGAEDVPATVDASGPVADVDSARQLTALQNELHDLGGRMLRASQGALGDLTPLDVLQGFVNEKHIQVNEDDCPGHFGTRELNKEFVDGVRALCTRYRLRCTVSGASTKEVGQLFLAMDGRSVNGQFRIRQIGTQKWVSSSKDLPQLKIREYPG